MMKYKLATWLALGCVAMLPSAVHAQELIKNGGFETSTAGNGQLSYNTNVTNWSISSPTGYTFLYSPGAGVSGSTADTTGATGQYGNVKLWGPGDGSANGLTLSPTGGNFIAQDGDYQRKALTQSITGLTVGKVYAVSFDWAAAQQSGFDGVTYDSWQVKLGTVTQTTPTVTIPSHGFSGWRHQTFLYTAGASSQTLSFLAAGGSPTGSTGVPPFALLDSVSLQAVPEAGTGAAVFTGVMAFGAFARRRARSARSRA